MKQSNETVAGITYHKPQVVLLQETGIGTSEYAARCCYDSFEASEHECIKELNSNIPDYYGTDDNIQSAEALTLNEISSIEHSELLDSLCHVYHHMSIAEHASLTFLIKGISRAVLIELSRHRIASYSVRSTRYTMSSVIYAFAASQLAKDNIEFFTTELLKLDMFVVQKSTELLEIEQLYNKLEHQVNILGKKEFFGKILSKDNLEYFRHCTMEDNPYTVLQTLTSGKQKRNAGDPLKWVVTDTWKVDLVMTINLRSLKNFFILRDSSASYFQIQWLAQAMKEVTPSKYLDLIVKNK